MDTPNTPDTPDTPDTAEDSLIIYTVSGFSDPLFTKYNLSYDFDGKLLGKGTFSHVYKTYNSESKQYCAIKVLRPKHQNYSKKEIKYLIKLGKHENIIPIQDYFIFNKHICIIYPLYCSNLYQLLVIKHNLYKKKYISKNILGLKIYTVKKVAHDILTALEYIKSKNIIHADVKPENILIERNDDTRTMKFVLCDFGSAYNGNSNFYGYHQSRFYRAPETVFRCDCTYAIDMWSIGCILYEILFNKVLFYGKNESDLLHKIIQIRGMFTTTYINNLRYKYANKYFHSDIKRNRNPIKRYILRSSYSGLNSQIATSYDISYDIVYERLTKKIKDRNMIIKVDENTINNFIELVLDMTEYEICNRITPTDALKHPFMIDTKYSKHTNNKLVYQDVCDILDYPTGF